jgi:tRNA(Arg) A34 adenosine deaminase TadA
MALCSYHAEHRYLRDIARKHVKHKYVCSLRIKKENGVKMLGDSMPCKMCCSRLKKNGVQKVIFYHKNELIVSHIDEIEKHAVYSSGGYYSGKTLNSL